MIKIVSLLISFFIFGCADVDHKLSGTAQITVIIEEKICDVYKDREDREMCVSMVLVSTLISTLDKNFCDQYRDPIQKNRCLTIFLDILDSIEE